MQLLQKAISEKGSLPHLNTDIPLCGSYNTVCHPSASSLCPPSNLGYTVNNVDCSELYKITQI